VLLLLASPAAKADLYRWVDPQSGSVKFSSVPPPASQPGVEVVPYRGPAAPPRPAPSSAAPLELRWRELLAELSISPAGSPQVQQRAQDFVVLTSELEQLDPAGAPRRRAEAQNVLQRLFKVER
jgi:uncharacterized protein DUF4124